MEKRSKSIEYCCDVFASHVNEAGSRGLSIVPKKTSYRCYFAFQSRRCDHADLQALEEMSRQIRLHGIEPAPKLNLVCEVGMRFCPWCGASLDELIGAQLPAVEEKARELAFLLQQRG